MIALTKGYFHVKAVLSLPPKISHIKERFTLPKTSRVTNRKVIDLLFSAGQSFSVPPFRIIYQTPIRSDTQLKAGFTVSKRNFKRAVDRNRIKRLMKECYRVLKNPLDLKLEAHQMALVIFMIYTGRQLPDHKTVLAKMLLIVQKLETSVDENLTTHS